MFNRMKNLVSIKTLVIVACSLSVSACLKVEDKSNDKVARAINEQNTILQQQANQTKTSVSVTGIVENISTGAKATNGTVTIKTGSTTSAPVTVTNGSFQVDNLPADSDYELTVRSSTNTFMSRTVFGKTRATNSLGIVYQDIGIIGVSAGVERAFKILNSVTNAPITNLVLHADSSVGTGANAEQYLHNSTYDATTQQYKIMLPERLGISVYSDLDVNNDGHADYGIEDREFGFVGGSLLIEGSAVINANPIYLIDLNTRIQIKISLVDDNLKPLLGAKPSIVNNLNGTLNATYNATTNQYLFDAAISNGLSVMIPSFTIDNKTYSSSSLQIAREPSIGSSRFRVSTSTNGNPVYFNFAKDEAHVFDVVIKPFINVTFSNISVASKSSFDEVVAEDYKVFYTGPVALNTDSVKLTKKNALKITKGNASSTDVVLAGTTAIDSSDETVEVTTQLSLNDTLLTVTPKAALAEGYYYNYAVGGLKDRSLGTAINVSNDDLDFYVKGTSTFAITDLKLDNNNYYTNGALINATNTANEAPNQNSINPNQAQSVLIYLPLSIDNLETLTLRKEKTTKENIEANTVQNISVVANGHLNQASKTLAVSLAPNENVVFNFSLFNLHKGSLVSDGYWYIFSADEYMQDNTGSSANNITFSYALETKAGAVETGTITLPVL
jgi:hypothetical protein